jgi:DNA polymerase-3 subunit gamma/tau
VASVLQKPEDALDMSAEEIAVVKNIIPASSEDQLTLMLSEIMKAEADVRNSSSPRLALEMALIRASFLSSMKPLKEVIENIDFYSRQVHGAAAEEISGLKPADKPVPAVQAETTEIDTSPYKEPEILHASDEPVKDEMREDPEEGLAEETSEDMDSDESVEEASLPPVSVSSADISSAWAKTLEKIDAPLASKISQATIELKENELLLTLNGGHAVFEDAINKNIKSLENIVSGEYGSSLRIKLATSQKKSPRKKDLKEKVLNEPVVKEALELFEGRIVDVAPLENIKNGGDHV